MRPLSIPPADGAKFFGHFYGRFFLLVMAKKLSVFDSYIGTIFLKKMKKITELKN